MKNTIRDVANLAGVSITTVSHVINKTRYVSDELCQRVNRAMEQLSYRPNILARSLRLGATKTIGLIVPDNSNPYFAEIARIIEDIGYENGYSVLLCNSDGLGEKEAAYVNMMIAKQVDGIIFIAAGNTQEHLNDLTNRNIPVVVVDRDIAPALADVVLVNNESGGYAATRYLLDLGHTKIACITGPSEITPSAGRVHGYRKALQEAGLTVRDECIIAGDFKPRSGEKAMAELLNLSDPPTAVFICNDLMALGAFRTLRYANKRVPYDISIVGFDDITLASELMPPLTTVAQPIVELATLAADLLITRIQNEGSPQPPIRTTLEPSLVLRDSCAKFSGER